MAEKEKKRKKAELETEEQNYDDGKIRVRICGREKGLEEFEKVNFVRVISKGYNLLIMQDYLPIIGKVEGDVMFRCGKREYGRTGIVGYFMHKANEFSLMLEVEGERAYD